MPRAPIIPTGLVSVSLLLGCAPDAGSSGADSTAGSAGAPTSAPGGGSAGTGSSSGGDDGTPGSGGSGMGGTSTGGAGAAAIAGAPSSAGSAGAPGMLSGTPVVFVGGFGSDPIRAYDLNEQTGALTPRGQPVDAGSMPSCLVTDAARKHLYVCNEDGGQAGGITAFSIGTDGVLTLLNHRSGSNQGFTQLAVSPNGKFIAGADYDGGTASNFPLMPDGTVGAELDAVSFGDGSQTHYVAFDPTGKFLLATSKGSREVQQLLVDDAGMLTPNQPPSVASEPGNAPRHMTVHPNGKLVYVVNEAGSSITQYALSADGKLTRGATISSLPADYSGSNTGAHIELSPNGKLLYVSNRGHDSIGVYSVNQDTGALTLIEHESSRGSAPHDFDIDPSGEILIAVNRKSSSLAVFAIAADGKLSPLGDPVETRPDPTGVLVTYLQ